MNITTPDEAMRAMWTIQTYYIPTLVVLGTLGNILSVIIFFQTKLRRASSSWYLAALAVSDTGFLASLLVAWLNLVNVGIFNRPGYCQFFIYLSTQCSFLSVWLVVSFTVERFIAVRYPLRRQVMCTVARAKMIVLGLVLLSLLVASPVLWFSDSRRIGSKVNATFCVLAEGWEDWARGFNIADTVLTFVLPFTIIAAMNGRIVVAVWRLAHVRRTLTSSAKSNKTQGQTKITKMLLVVSTFFLCFNLPAYVMRVRAFLEMNENPPRSVIIIQHVCNLLFHTSFGMNFILYCASGENFRKAVLNLLRKEPGRFNSSSRPSRRITQHGTPPVPPPNP